MAKLPGWIDDVARSLRKPLGGDEYRALGVVAAGGVLLGAVLGLIAVARWDVALVCAVLAIPGSLLCGAMHIVLRKRKRAL